MNKDFEPRLNSPDVGGSIGEPREKSIPRRLMDGIDKIGIFLSGSAVV